jgi:hypothetical protein
MKDQCRETPGGIWRVYWTPLDSDYLEKAHFLRRGLMKVPPFRDHDAINPCGIEPSMVHFGFVCLGQGCLKRKFWDFRYDNEIIRIR